jgi:serine/threonine protein kinase
MVPEWILQNRYNGERACVWALGVCLYFLLFQKYPFRTKQAICNGRSRLPFSSSPDKEAYNTMKQCINGNEYRRPKLNSLQHLSWLQEINSLNDN